MSSISSMSAAVSALMSSQTALNTTAHNLSNVNTTGYVRQQVLFKDRSYLTVGQNNTTGFYVGMGVDVNAIRQVRDQFLDQSFRNEFSREGFYSSKNNGIEELETILGETEGESFASVLDDLWTSINELSKHPDGLETRGSFVENAVLFVNRANLISEQFNSYQDNLNTEVKNMVTNINSMGEQIYELNNIIARQEVNGGNANDYRDQRNDLLDQLSEMVDISYKEDMKGHVLVKVEGIDFVTLTGTNEMGLAEAEPFSSLVKPVWKHLSSTNNSVYNLNETISTENDNDKGALKGLLLTRGSKAANWTDMQVTATYEANIKPSVIMNAQAQFDNLVHGIVTMINDLVSPNTGAPLALDTVNAPYGLDGSQGIEIFTRKNLSRYNGINEYNVEDPTNTYTLYSAGNIEINQQVLEDYDKICLSSTSGDDGDNTLVQEMITKWQEPFSAIEPGLTLKVDFNTYYNDYISNIGNEGSSTSNQVSNQQLMINQIDNKRSTLMGVSSDEELGNMIKYQQAYNAAAKIISVLDEMMKQVVSSTGLVGR